MSFIIIHWIPLIIGLCFGLIPPRALIKGEVRYLMFEDLWEKALRPPPDDPRRRRWWKMPLVWIDPVRGFATAYYLVQAFPKPPRGSGLSIFPVLTALAVSSLICLAVQMSGRKNMGETISPTGFLSGMLLLILPYNVSIPVLIVAACTVIAVRSYAAGYVAAALVCLIFGFLYMGVSLSLITPMGLIILPLFSTWKSGSRMVVPVRC